MKNNMIEANNVSVRFGCKNYNGDELEVDVALAMLNSNNKVSDIEDFIFYRNISHLTGCIEIDRDFIPKYNFNSVEYDSVKIDFRLIPENVMKVVLIVSVHSGRDRGQTLEMMGSSFVQILDSNDNEINRYDFSPIGDNVSMIVGELSKEKDNWFFNDREDSFEDELFEVLEKFI